MPRRCVLITHFDGTREARELPDGRLLIGRSAECWLNPVDPALSRLHAALNVEGGNVTIDCLPSRNGTFLNGKRVEGRFAVRPADEVKVGRTQLCFPVAVPEEQRRDQATIDLPPAGGALQRPVGVSRQFCAVVERAEKVAGSDIAVLITGESGTGKELLARYIHICSGRGHGPLQILNCPALTPSLVESELFGVEAGVATGVQSRPGLLEQADGGTIFLDEVADLPLEVQAKLLRFLQELSVIRVGGRKATTVDARVIAATNKDLEAAIAAGTFRSDLYYRLAGVTLAIPPLRERRDDVFVLADFFLHELAPGRSFSERARRLFRSYAFPGNVRELETIVRRSALLNSRSDTSIELDLPGSERPASAGEGVADQARQLLVAVEASRVDFWAGVYEPFLTRELPRAVLRELVAMGLAESGGSVKVLAARLHVADRYRKLLDFLRNNRLLPSDPPKTA